MFTVFLVHGQTDAACREAYTATEVLQLACAGIRGHDDDRIAEVDKAAVAIGEATFVHYLQEQVEHIAVGFLNLVEQHDGVGLTAHALSKLASLLIAYIARRGTNQTADIERLGIL